MILTSNIDYKYNEGALIKEPKNILMLPMVNTTQSISIRRLSLLLTVLVRVFALETS